MVFLISLGGGQSEGHCYHAQRPAPSLKLHSFLFFNRTDCLQLAAPSQTNGNIVIQPSQTNGDIVFSSRPDVMQTMSPIQVLQA